MADDQPIPHNRPSIDDDDVASVAASLRSLWLAPGPETDAFERAFAAYHGDGFEGVAVSSGTAALFLALHVLGVARGDEVLVPTYSCSALLNAVIMTGATPVPVDVDPASWNIAAAAAERALTPRTRALVVTHAFGVPADLEPLRALGVPVIEDCAQAVGAEIGGRKVGTFGDVAVFSFFATKMLTTGHGGMVMAGDAALVAGARDYRAFDGRETYVPRFNLQMTDFQAALGRSQLGRLDRSIARRRAIGEHYRSALDGRVEGWQAAAVDGARANGFRHVALVDDAAATVEAMRTDGVSAAVPIERHELLHRYLGLGPATFEVAEWLVGKTLSLPAFPALDDAMVERVTATAKKALT